MSDLKLLSNGTFHVLIEGDGSRKNCMQLAMIGMGRMGAGGSP